MKPTVACSLQKQVYETDLESILKADSLSRTLEALSTNSLPPKDACCIAALYFPSAASTILTSQARAMFLTVMLKQMHGSAFGNHSEMVFAMTALAPTCSQ